MLLLVFLGRTFLSQVFYIKLKVFSMKNFGGREHPLTLGQASHLISDRKPLSGPGLLVAVHEVVMVHSK